MLAKNPSEKHAKVVMLSEDRSAVTDVWFHIRDNKLWMDNKEPDIYV